MAAWPTPPGSEANVTSGCHGEADAPHRDVVLEKFQCWPTCPGRKGLRRASPLSRLRQVGNQAEAQPSCRDDHVQFSDRRPEAAASRCPLTRQRQSSRNAGPGLAQLTTTASMPPTEGSSTSAAAVAESLIAGTKRHCPTGALLARSLRRVSIDHCVSEGQSGAIVDRVEVDDREIRIVCRNDVLEQAASRTAAPVPGVRSFVRKWRA